MICLPRVASAWFVSSLLLGRPGIGLEKPDSFAVCTIVETLWEAGTPVLGTGEAGMRGAAAAAGKEFVSQTSDLGTTHNFTFPRGNFGGDMANGALN